MAGRNINPVAILPNKSELAGGPSGDAAVEEEEVIRIGRKKPMCQPPTPIMLQFSFVWLSPLFKSKKLFFIVHIKKQEADVPL